MTAVPVPGTPRHGTPSRHSSNGCANMVVRSPVMDLPAPRSAPSDGALVCRIDGTGRRIAVLPATCKAGTHPIAAHHGATVSAGELVLSCPPCAAMSGVDHSWRFTLTEPSPEGAELDDEPYRHRRARLESTARIR